MPRNSCPRAANNDSTRRPAFSSATWLRSLFKKASPSMEKREELTKLLSYPGVDSGRRSPADSIAGRNNYNSVANLPGYFPETSFSINPYRCVYTLPAFREIRLRSSGLEISLADFSEVVFVQFKIFSSYRINSLFRGYLDAPTSF